MSLKQRLIGNRRGKMQELVPEAPQEEQGFVHRLTAENAWLKSVARSMLKRALKDSSKVIMAKEEDHVLFSDGHFMAIVDGTFLEWFFDLEGCNTEAGNVLKDDEPRTIKEFFDSIETGRAFTWSAGNAFIIADGVPNPHAVMVDTTSDTQVDLVLCAWGYAVGKGENGTFYTTWPFIHCIMPPSRNKDPHLVAESNPKKAFYVQQDLVRIFGDDYGKLKYTIREDALAKMDETNTPIAVWSPDDKLMGVVCRFNSDIKAYGFYRDWQKHLQR